MKSHLFLVLLFCFSPLQAQYTPEFYVKNYPPRTYNKHLPGTTPENHAILQDEDGIMYFTNNQGLIEFDGTDWRLLPYDRIIDIRSLEKTKDGTIAVAGRKGAGIFRLNQQGEYYYTNLLNQLRSALKEPPANAEFYCVYKKGDFFYFITRFGSIFYHFQLVNNQLVLLNRIESLHNPQYYVSNERIFRYVDGQGLDELINQQWEQLLSTNLWQDKFIYLAINLSDNNTLFGAFSGELYFLSPKQSTLRQYTGEAAEYCIKHQLLNAKQNNDGNLILSTVRGGVIVATLAGDIIYSINKDNYLYDNTAFDALEDRQGGIWIALFNGIARVQPKPALSFFDENHGLEGSVSSVIRFKDVLFANTVTGSYYLKGKQFKKVKGSPLESGFMFTFKPTNNPSKQEVLFSGFDGLYQIKGFENKSFTANKIQNTPGRAFTSVVSSKTQNRLYLSSITDGIFVLDYNDGEWSKSKYITTDSVHFSGAVIEDRYGNLWSLSSKKETDFDLAYPTRIKLDATTLEVQDYTVFDSSVQQLPIISYLYSHQDEVVGISNEGLFYFNDQTKQFKPYYGLGKAFSQGKQSLQLLYLAPETNTLLAFTKDKNGNTNKKPLLLYPQADDSYQIDSTSLISLSNYQVNSWPFEKDSIMWLPTNDGLFRFDKSQLPQFNYKTLIRKVSTNKDSVLYHGIELRHDLTGNDTSKIATRSQLTPPQLPYDFNSIKLEYSALFFEQSEELVYSHTLIGFGDEAWSDWSSENYTFYNNLMEGKYAFQVKARNVYGQISEIATYQFEILPPLYRTLWAYVIYILAFLALIYMIIRINSVRLKQQNKRLSNIVKERTQELHSRNEEILSQAEELRLINSRMVELDRFKEDMNNMIVHDLKTPLTAVLGHLDNPERVKLHAMGMLRLINDLLDIQKSDHTELILEEERVALSELIKQVYSQVEAMLYAKGLTLNTHGLHQFQVFAQTNLIVRVLINLITNAIKYSPLNSEIKISAAIHKSNWVQISVTDYGEGIPQDQLHQIFEKFKQVEARKQGHLFSTGLGLTFCKMAIEAHNGQIGVNSSLGMGTTFWFRLIGQKIHKKSVEATTNTNPTPKLSQTEIDLLKTLLPQLASLKTYQGLAIEETLAPILEGTNGLKGWAEKVIQAAYATNDKLYNELLTEKKEAITKQD